MPALLYHLVWMKYTSTHIQTHLQENYQLFDENILQSIYFKALNDFT